MADPDAAGSLRAVVALVEPMGSHQVVWVKAGQATLSVLVHEPRAFAAGDEVGIAIDPARVSLFDPETGARL